MARLGCLAVALALSGFRSPLVAQELDPRAYRPLPVGLNFGQLTYTYSSGNVLVDATAPVDGLDLDLHTILVGYLGTFSLLGRLSSFSIGLPYVLGSGSAEFNGEPITGDRAAPGDIRMRLATNLLGGPALSPVEFARRPPGRSLGAGFVASVPTGQHNSKNIVNYGANRWGFKPELGYSHVHNRWITELTAGVWMFTDNEGFFGGKTKSQEPIGSIQAHLSYTLRNGMWLALDANYFFGGRSTLDGVRLDDSQENSRIGVTWSIPLGHRHSVKFAAHSGAYTRAGADFDTVSVSYLRQFGSPGPGSSPLEDEQ